jgi:signal transduction histidine kinase
MRLKRIEPNKSLALTQVNRLLGRVFSLAATLVGAQTISNALIQNATHQLNQLWFWLALGALIASHLALIYTVWVVGDGRLGFVCLTISTAFAMATWHLQLGDVRLEPGVQPWIWWSVGIAGVSAIGGFNFYTAVFFMVAIPTSWFLIQISEFGVAADYFVALQDASFAFLFVAVLAGFVYALRYESAKVDQANQKANQAAIDLARADAVHRERDRIDALVHDSVLTTLLVSSNAADAEAERESELLASAAIQKLIAAHLVGSSDQTISVSSLFGALEVAIRRQSMKINIDIEGASDELVPGEVAAAVTESTLQALANAIQHAGSAAKIEVFLRGSKKGIKIVVKDDGRGFRPARIPKNRLGLKLSIVGRMRSVGGRVFIDSNIGIGTNVVIEWSAN